jgi:class 3 adenylate cyclase/tetratricopeptide (TPR) repeat protein
VSLADSGSGIASVAGERRHLTVLFCDLVGSTEIAAQLDPEEWRELVASYHRAAAEAITRSGGHVAKFLGDGVMAYFGWPEAHENDAERAARSGLAILEAVSTLNQESITPQLSVRVGIDSGMVVVGGGAGKEAEAFGETPNIAARVQSAAAPDSVLITAATHRLLSGLFVVEDAGAQQFKGVANLVQLYRVLRPTGVRARLAVARGLTPFVGRDEELRLLLSRWERAREGEGQVVMVVGEAGIGKSRMVAEFHDRIRDTPHIWMESAGEQFFENTPFHAVSQMLSRWLELQGGASREEQFERLERALESADLNVDETAPLIGELLQLPVGERYQQSKLAREEKRRRLLSALAGWAFGAARLQPVVMLVEDLHWLDPSTLDSQQLLAEQSATAPLMLLHTARPEFRAPWPQRAHHTQITLNRLSPNSVREMIAHVTARKALADEAFDAVVERTGGVPLFIEELTRAVLENGAMNFRTREIPVTLHDSLMARLDRLGSAKEVAQVGAVIGSDFSYELLHAVYPIADEELRRALHSLTDTELLYARGLVPDAIYQFKHGLIRDAAYEALLKSRRKELHRQVAQTIDGQFPALKDSSPELLARHWTEAGEMNPAIAEWQRAGERAIARSAYREAEQHYRLALDLLNKLPESSERDTRELNLQIALGGLLGATRGYSSAATGDPFARARVLSERGGVDKALQVLNGLWGTAHTRGEQRKALALADQMLETAQTIGSTLALSTAHYAAGLPRIYLGDLTGAQEHLRLAIQYYREKDLVDRPVPNVPGVGVHVFAAQNEWRMGYPDRALRHVDDAIAIAHRRNDTYAMVFALSVGAFVYGARGDFSRTVEVSEEALRLSASFGFPLQGAIAKIRSSWARARIGETTGVVDRIQEGIAEFNALKFYLARPHWLGVLSEAQAAARSTVEALATLEEALEPNLDELIERPDLLRLRGELILLTNSAGGARLALAERDFLAAIEAAQRMQAKSYELRATTSLARLLAQQGRSDEALAMLAEIYNWFTEGFDTADLKHAKTLLDELGA